MYRTLRGDYAAQGIVKILKKFKKTGVVTNIERLVHHHFAHYAENIVIVSASVDEDPNVPILRLSQELGLSYATL